MMSASNYLDVLKGAVPERPPIFFFDFTTLLAFALSGAGFFTIRFGSCLPVAPFVDAFFLPVCVESRVAADIISRVNTRSAFCLGIPAGEDELVAVFLDVTHVFELDGFIAGYDFDLGRNVGILAMSVLVELDGVVTSLDDELENTDVFDRRTRCR